MFFSWDRVLTQVGVLGQTLLSGQHWVTLVIICAGTKLRVLVAC